MNAGESVPTVFLVEDDASVRASLSCALINEGFRVRSWKSAEAFLAEFDPRHAGCLLSDAMLPGTNGLQLQTILAQVNRDIPIVFISGNPDVRCSVQAMRAGAVTFLTKPVQMAELTDALHEAIEIDRQRRERHQALVDLQDRLASLTPREREVMNLVVTGRMNKQISAQLGMAEKTVKVHRGRVMKKMKVRMVADLVTIASCLGQVRGFLKAEDWYGRASG